MPRQVLDLVYYYMNRIQFENTLMRVCKGDKTLMGRVTYKGTRKSLKVTAKGPVYVDKHLVVVDGVMYDIVECNHHFTWQNVCRSSLNGIITEIVKHLK